MRAAASSSAPFTVRRLTPNLGAEISGLDLARGVSPEAFQALYDAFLEHQVLVFPPHALPPGAQVAFARNFGEVQVHVMAMYHADGFPELYRLSNLDANGNPDGKHPDKGTLYWHTDGSWRRVTGQATMLYAEQIPSRGGGTQFADMYSAYEALGPAEQARLGRMRAVHSLDFSRNRRHGEDPMSEAQRAAVPPVDHPIVRTHPETGRKCIFLGDHAESIVGMGYDEGREFIEALNQRVVGLARRYEHRWRPRDFMVWDNRCLMHKAEGYDTAQEPRVIRRCTVLGDEPR